jgi:mRNA-degrading endonuclease RelE of RelBE toxin-antitoxin system
LTNEQPQFRFESTARFIKEYKKLPQKLKPEIKDQIKEFLSNPSQPASKFEDKHIPHPKLQNDHFRCFRVGQDNYRVIYKRLDMGIGFVLIGHRKDIYETFKRATYFIWSGGKPKW